MNFSLFAGFLMLNKTNLKDIDFDEILLATVALFDEVLSDLGEPPLLENENFAPFSDFLVDSNYLVLTVVSKKSNVLPIIIWFEGDGLRIDIEGMAEIFEWAQKHIDEDRNAVIEVIKNLFTGYTSIETYGASRFVQIFDANGFFVSTFSYNNFFQYLFRHKHSHRLYLPLFSKAK